MARKRDDAATAKLNLRMPEPLRARLEAEAKRRGVSMNALILSHLEHSFLIGDIKSAVHEALNEAGFVKGLNERQVSPSFPRGNAAVNPYAC